MAVAIAVHASLAGAAFAAALTLLARGAARRPEGPGAATAPGGRAEVNRREFLSRSVLLAAALTGAGAVAQWLDGATARAGAAVRSLFDRIKGLPPEVTPTDRFYHPAAQCSHHSALALGGG